MKQHLSLLAVGLELFALGISAAAAAENPRIVKEMDRSLQKIRRAQPAHP